MPGHFGLMHEMNSLVENLGRGIRKRRQYKGLTQERLAELAGLHRTYICDMERGARNVTVSTLASVANALGTTIAELYFRHRLEIRAAAVENKARRSPHPRPLPKLYPCKRNPH